MRPSGRAALDVWLIACRPFPVVAGSHQRPGHRVWRGARVGGGTRGMTVPQPGAGEGVTTARLDTIEQIAQLTASLTDIMDASSSVATDDEHDPEGATIAFERAQVAALLDRARARLTDLDEALARLAAGTYGSCESCGRPIGPERLAARPSARTCIACASRR